MPMLRMRNRALNNGCFERLSAVSLETGCPNERGRRLPLCANGAFFFGLFAAISARQFCFPDPLSQLVQFA
jgi:hypothetical protein